MSITEEGITDTEMLVEWLRAIADDVERRGIEPMSLSGFTSVGTADVTKEDDEVRHFNPTRDYFVALNWRFEEDA